MLVVAAAAAAAAVQDAVIVQYAWLWRLLSLVDFDTVDTGAITS